MVSSNCSRSLNNHNWIKLIVFFLIHSCSYISKSIKKIITHISDTARIRGEIHELVAKNKAKVYPDNSRKSNYTTEHSHRKSRKLIIFFRSCEIIKFTKNEMDC